MCQIDEDKLNNIRCKTIRFYENNKKTTDG